MTGQGSGSRRALRIMALMLATAATPALAGAPDDATPPVADGDEIVVTGRDANASIIGSDISVLRYPQSVRVLDRQELDAVNANRLGDVLDLAGGVSRQNDFGGLWDKFAIRGFAGDENSGPDIQINRFSSNYGFNAPYDLATIERVEVLKGATAALSGRGEPGGAINLVTKAPLDTLAIRADASYGSWNFRRLTADATGPVAKDLSLRLIGVVEDRDSFRDHVGGSRRLIAPSVAWAPLAGLRLLYQAEYMRNTTVLDRGVVGVNGDARAMDRRTFLGEPGDGRIRQNSFWQQASLFADLGSGIGLELGGSQRDGSLRGFATMVDFGARGLQKDGRTAGRDRRYHDFGWNDLSLRGELTARVQALGLDHDLRIGIDRVRHGEDFVLNRARGTASRPLLPIDLFDPVYASQPLPVPPPFADRHTSFRSDSLYAQDVIRHAAFTLLLGARLNRFEERLVNHRSNDRLLRTLDKGLTPRIALSWQAMPGWSLYTSYGQSLRLNPSDGTSTFDAERSRSFEVGTKFDLLDGHLTGQAALFDMVKRNVLNPNATDVFVHTQVGRQRSRGAEVDLTLRLPRDLIASAAYTYVDATVVRDVDPALIGQPLSNVPAHQANLFVQKQFGRAQAGGGVTYVGRRAGDPFGSAYRLPAYTIARVDLGYALTDRLTVRADIDNLFDTYYIASSYAAIWTMPGAPRSGRITASLRF
ncbi:iron complex outermembrane receptor protein [Sphingomonas sp. SORGH_AS802]|uniref:TonB-dependent siderophore receptor n=1 Tax=Sphingomonas sp. SORGH_AS_0802 TaxID=3041800 RepID=UPI002854FB25|nr:TonB-dependent siderophore receptor [Sphingomonas sp. SORGH_AS_0802]MDR6134643.1 iron complex outermembrane receptor protein [Sphingomonas sp. SORGH_AS_0802]